MGKDRKHNGYIVSENDEITYEVVICKGKNYIFTDSCAACGKTLKKNDKKHRINSKFVICNECHQARRTIFFKKAQILFISVIIGLLSFLAAAFLYIINYFVSTVVAIVFTSTAFTILSILLHAPTQAENIYPEPPVKIKYNKKSDKTVFVFKSGVFADKFRRDNCKTLMHSDTFEHPIIREKRKSRSSMMGCMNNFSLKVISAAMTTLLLLLCFYPFLSKWQTNFRTYITNVCIYPECSLNRNGNLYYCDVHKCLTEQCQRPIYKDGPYCHIHNGEE